MSFLSGIIIPFDRRLRIFEENGGPDSGVMVKIWNQY